MKLNEIEVAGIANNGAEAISMYESFSTKPDIILMDHQMPIKTGLAAAREILQINSQQKIIFISADRDFLSDPLLSDFKIYNKSMSFNDLIKDIKETLIACC